MPRELIRAPGHDRDRSLGWLGIAWMEHFCRHGPGDVQGEPVRHDLELSAFLADAYALDPAGRRLYDSVFFSRPKGRDKSGTAARVALLEALGPCRFAGWAEGGEVYAWLDFEYRYRPGEPMGRPVRSPFVRLLATEEGQTGNVYDSVYFNLTDDGAPLSRLPGLDAGMTRTYLPGGRPGSGEIRPSTASSAAKDGGLESFAVFDEGHLYRLPELVRMYATVRRNLAKRRAAEPWSLEPSTMYAPGEGSVAEATHALAKLIRQGKARSARLLFDHRQGPADVDPDDEVALRAALEEAYGDFAAVMDLDRLVAEIQDPRNAWEDSRRYFLNVATPSAGRFLDSPEQWAGCADLDQVVASGTAIALGFDGSLRQDATALRGCTEEGHLFTIGIWEKPEGPAGDGWQVPAGEVDAAVAMAFERYQVVRAYYDPAWWGSWVAKWAARHGDDKVVEWWTNRDAPMAKALASIRTAIVQRELTQDGDPVAARHWANAHKRPSRLKDDDGRPMVLIGKERPGSPHKIDVAMADTLAFEARNDALAAGLFEPTQAPFAFFGTWR
jgi:hypothetical protein